MKALLIIALLPILFAGKIMAEELNTANEKVVFQPKDKEIAEEVFKRFSADKNLSTGELVLKIGLFFKETPYVAHTLEMVPEQLVVNLRELDCTTFAESVLALALTVKDGNPGFEQFCKALQTIRYHHGKINGYASRIHYFSDWIYENTQKGLVEEIGKRVGGEPYPLNVNFMSTHPESYKQIQSDNSLITTIALQENAISSRKMYFIPEGKLKSVETQLNDGDIVGLTTTIKGMDVSHVGILIKQNGRVHLLHASSVLKKVVVSAETLEEYLMNSKSVTGIMLARPK